MFGRFYELDQLRQIDHALEEVVSSLSIARERRIAMNLVAGSENFIVEVNLPDNARGSQ